MAPFTQPLKAGGFFHVNYTHSDKPLSSAQLNIEKAFFFEKKGTHHDRIVVDGQLSLVPSQMIKMEKNFNITVGKYSKSIPVGKFWKKATKNKVEYTYRHCDLFIKFDSNGNFKVIIENPGFDIDSAHPSRMVTVQVDSASATVQKRFKIFDKRHKDYDHECKNYDH